MKHGLLLFWTFCSLLCSLCTGSFLHGPLPKVYLAQHKGPYPFFQELVDIHKVSVHSSNKEAVVSSLPSTTIQIIPFINKVHHKCIESNGPCTKSRSVTCSRANYNILYHNSSDLISFNDDGISPDHRCSKVPLTWSRYVLLPKYGCNPTFLTITQFIVGAGCP